MLSFLCQKQVTLARAIMSAKNVILCDSRLQKSAKVLKNPKNYFISERFFKKLIKNLHFCNFFENFHSKFVAFE